jgi:hypothetical protein
MSITHERIIMRIPAQQAAKPIYPCGPHTREFKGTPEEWERMSSTIVQRALVVTCPHCGAQNTHHGRSGHRVCEGLPGVGYYPCPGYVWD